MGSKEWGMLEEISFMIPLKLRDLGILYFRFSGKMVTSTYRALRPIDQNKDKQKVIK